MRGFDYLNEWIIGKKPLLNEGDFTASDRNGINQQQQLGTRFCFYINKIWSTVIILKADHFVKYSKRCYCQFNLHYEKKKQFVSKGETFADALLFPVR